MDNFDLKKFLVENKLTENSRILKEDTVKEEVESEYMSGAYDFMMFASNNLDNPDVEGIWDEFEQEYGDGSETNMGDGEWPPSQERTKRDKRKDQEDGFAEGIEEETPSREVIQAIRTIEAILERYFAGELSDTDEPI